MLPAQQSWADSGLANDAVASFFDSNYVAMRADNVEHTFVVPLHTNDFIPPLNRDTRKTIQFSQNAQRGWGLATPHIGFAIQAPTARTVLGQNLQSTVAPITLYVDNASGSDSASGLSPATAKLTIGSALAQLPPVLRHPCTVILADTGLAFNVSQMQGALDVVALGDGDIRSSKVYCLGNLSRVIQDEGRLVVSRAASATVNRSGSVTHRAMTGTRASGTTANAFVHSASAVMSPQSFSNCATGYTSSWPWPQRFFTSLSVM